MEVLQLKEHYSIVDIALKKLTDTELVERYSGGDENAFRELKSLQLNFCGSEDCLNASGALRSLRKRITDKYPIISLTGTVMGNKAQLTGSNRKPCQRCSVGSTPSREPSVASGPSIRTMDPRRKVIKTFAPTYE